MSESTALLTLYRCHKIVRAFMVGKVEGNRIYAADSLAYHEAAPEFLFKHNLNQPGYLVFYEDGYVSFSPAKAFEAGYTPAQEHGLTFGEALQALKSGQRLARRGWNGKSMWIRMVNPSPDHGMTHPFLCIEYPVGHPAYPHGSRIPWLASQTDLLTDDWMIIG